MNEFVARKGLQSLRSSSFEETVHVSGSIYSPAEAFLTASWASYSISSTYAATASYVNPISLGGSASTSSIPNTLTLRDSNGGTGFKHILFDTAGTSQPAQTGMIKWNTFEGTLDVSTDVNDVTIQVGQETLLRGRNNTGDTILNGTVVYFSGSLGNKVMIWPAIASSSAQLNGLIGVATSDIPKNSDSYVTLFGKVNEIDTSMYNEGDQLYLSDVNVGKFTTISPTGSSYPIRVGRVLRSHPVSGSIIIQARQDYHTYNQYKALIDLADGEISRSLNISGSIFVGGSINSPSTAYLTSSWSINSVSASYTYREIYSLNSIVTASTSISSTGSWIKLSNFVEISSSNSPTAPFIPTGGSNLMYSCLRDGLYEIEFDCQFLKTSGSAASFGIGLIVDNSIENGSYKTQTIISNGTEYELDFRTRKYISSGSIIYPAIVGTSNNIKTVIPTKLVSGMSDVGGPKFSINLVK